eukprot:m.305798 g.305798  ORF g.305798 m.305798 type:complete len:326 (+) comp20189_c0_seq4:221-1198(+)
MYRTSVPCCKTFSDMLLDFKKVLLAVLFCSNPSATARPSHVFDCAVPAVTSVKDGSRVWLSGGRLGRIFSGGKWSRVERVPSSDSPTKSAGVDKHGAYLSTSCDWPRGPTASEPTIRTVVTVYPQLGATVYTLAFPDGAENTNASVPGDFGQRSKPGKINTDGVGPFAEFPLFDLSQGIARNSSWMTWNQGLQFHDTSFGSMREHVNNITGLARGPLVLFDEANMTSSTSVPAAVISQLNHIRVGAALVRPSGCSVTNFQKPCLMSYGPSWELTAVSGNVCGIVCYNALVWREVTTSGFDMQNIKACAHSAEISHIHSNVTYLYS